MFPRIKSFGLFVALPLGIPAVSARAQTEPIRLGVLTDMCSLYADIESLGLQSAQGSNCPIDIHQTDGQSVIMESVGPDYGFCTGARCPQEWENLIVAGRCISADPIAVSSTRNTPARALTSEAAGHCRCPRRPRCVSVRGNWSSCSSGPYFF